MNLLRPERLRVWHENDLVLIECGRARLQMAYGTGAIIAKALRVAGSHAAMVAGVSARDRRALKRSMPNEAWDQIAAARALEAPAGPRRTESAAGLRWAVKVDGQLATLEFGNVAFSFEGPGALEIAVRLRVAARLAKRWAGDTSSTRSAGGILTNAEDNYRRGLA